MLKHMEVYNTTGRGLITVQDNTMLKPAYDLKKLKISLITVQDNTMLKLPE